MEEPQNIVMFLHGLAVMRSFDIPNVWAPCLKKLLCQEDPDKYRTNESFNRTLALAIELFEIDNPQLRNEPADLVNEVKSLIKEEAFSANCSYNLSRSSKHFAMVLHELGY